ncbi:MAG: Asp-tRNA(Asn)/Glu-tRNA(Gln) amidotransferase subunit GatA [Alphaproteobacteria bacterium]|nr:Asp-tRNA(Asn)/Glu-tRNA(Gln) amidotransferase subunit GatA [Alphaproteobacteria bacterium]
MAAANRLSIVAARAALAKGEVSAAELAELHLAAIEKTKDLNAWVVVAAERARAMAKAADTRLAAARQGKGAAGLLDGIPLAVKDMFCTAGVQTTASSRILEGFVPTYESTVTTKLWEQGAVMLGKVSCDEFAMGSSNATSAWGPVKNPWLRKGDNRPLVPGGSSGGSAAAVAARAAMGATGTDTGGSIRQPAAFVGITGLKPTYGRCSRWGIVAFASSLDQAGPMARTVKDCALMLQAMAGFDPKDSTSVDRPVPDYVAACGGSLKGLRIGVPKEYRPDGMDPVIDRLWEQGVAWLRDAGAVPVPISLPNTKHALPAYYVIAPAEASSNLARYDGVRFGRRVPGEDLTDLYERTRGEGFGAEVKRRILIGTYVLSAGYYDAYYLKAQKVRRLIADDFDAAFRQCDAILTPTTPTAAFALGEKQDDPVAMYLNDVLTVTVNLAGLPGLSVPAGLSGEGLPLGLQVIGRAFDEETVLKVGQAIEAAARFEALPQVCA